MNAISLSLSGLQAGMIRFAAGAANVANVASQDRAPVRVVQNEMAGGGVVSRIAVSSAPAVDLSDEMVGMLTGKIAVQANARMLETIHDLDKGLLRAFA